MSVNYISRIAHPIRLIFSISWLSLAAFASVAQEAEDGVIGACVAQGNANDVCICASLLLHARLGDQKYARFGAISDRIAAIDAGASPEEGEMMALTSEGYRYFIPHGQAIAVCRDKLSAGE
ncbi:MAG TPA: hypothetical protein EYG79_03895 [Rhodobacteraceae bacterium]|nr:hypothetical protein [Paracoccaceae bacterium]